MKDYFDTICSAIDNARIEFEDMESELSYFRQEVERLLSKVKELDLEREQLEVNNQVLQEQVRKLERQRDFLLMRGKTPACLLCDDCSYLVGEPCNWGCTAKLEIRKKCLEKAVERAERATGKTANVDAEEATKE